MAKGLENILYRCPECGAEFSMVTNGNKIMCENCAFASAIDDRYAFVNQNPFKNLSDWYYWQVEQTKSELIKNPDLRLESKVELRHSSKDGKSTTRFAGKGVCVFDRNGLTYKGTDDGQEVEKFFALSDIYRILFGAGEDFEIYEGKEIWYFVPEEKRSCVKWYVYSCILKEIYGE